MAEARKGREEILNPHNVWVVAGIGRGQDSEVEAW